MLISLENITKVYVNGQISVNALLPITTQFESGEFICIIGPSGCGKSTLLRLIAAQIQPTTGQITLNEFPPDTIRHQKGIAWMAQDPALLPWKTVKENIQLSTIVNSKFNHLTFEKEDFLHLVDLDGFAYAYPTSLSGGMQQRVALARTLAIGASIWLMDEPFAALDEFTREQLANTVLSLWAAFNPTVLWVTHSILEAVSLADRIIVISHRPGKIKADIAIQQPRPRDVTQTQCLSLVRNLREMLNP
jgi:NitT/TauT family transport system ATP-binding protein